MKNPDTATLFELRAWLAQHGKLTQGDKLLVQVGSLETLRNMAKQELARIERDFDPDRLYS